MAPGASESSDSEEARTSKLAARVVQRLAALPGGPANAEVRGLRRLGHSALSSLADSWKVTLAIGETTCELVLRGDGSPSLGSLPGTLDRADEYAVVQAATAAGVTTPTPRWLVQGLTREAASSYFVPFVPGETRGERIVSSPELAPVREALAAQIAREAAKIHAVTATSPDRPTSFPGLKASERDCDAAAASLAWLRGMLDGLSARRPALELVLDWLTRTRPPVGPVVLVHGDFRVGNFVVSPAAAGTSAGLAAILGWDFAHWGAPEEDLAWLCLRSFRFGQLARPVGGISQRAPFYRAYAEASGRVVDPARVHWWEVLGNCRAAVACAFQAERYLQHPASDVELAVMGRRTAEVEWEALRLVDLAAREDWRDGWRG
jgi:aminoglycoside phosphotransferase (APT) family kinase protein